MQLQTIDASVPTAEERGFTSSAGPQMTGTEAPAAMAPRHTVPLLDAAQVAQFKAEVSPLGQASVPRAPTSLTQPSAQGFLVLPGALDAGLCARAREQMWQTLSAAIPGMTPDPATWPRDLASAGVKILVEVMMVVSLLGGFLQMPPLRPQSRRP